MLLSLGIVGVKDSKKLLEDLPNKIIQALGTVSDRIKSLKEKGVIIRVGSDTKGYWNINE